MDNKDLAQNIKLIESVAGDNGSSLYEIKVDDHNAIMSYSSMDNNWAYPGKKCAELHDNEDEVIIKLEKKKIKLDYCDAYYVYKTLEAYYAASDQNQNDRTYRLEIIEE